MKKLVSVLLPFVFATVPAQGRSYDCSRAGNAHKTLCKGSVAAPAVVTSMVSAPTTAKVSRLYNYDCTKLANKFGAVCRGQSAMSPAATPQAAVPPDMAGQPAAKEPGGQMNHADGPNSATALCKDGTYSHSAHHSGTCSGHYGVATWNNCELITDPLWRI